MAIQILQYSPGQKVTLFLETLDLHGNRADSMFLPTVDRMIFPDFTLAPNFPQNMTRIDTGFYYFQFTLPTGGSAVGSYELEATYFNANVDGYDGYINSQLYQVIVNSPYGNFGATPF